MLQVGLGLVGLDRVKVRVTVRVTVVRVRGSIRVS